MGENKLAELEAVLYASGRPLTLTQIVTQLKLDDEDEASNLVGKLKDSYGSDETALEVVNLPQERVVLQLKSEYTKPASKFSIKPLLSKGPLRTLSYIAYNQPIDQKKVASARGSHSYKHVKMLEELGLITRERMGRTYIIRTTEEFADYLGLSHNKSYMKRQLQRMFKKLELDQIETSTK